MVQLDLIVLAQWVLLAGFLFATVLLLAVTLHNRRRIRRRVCSWYPADRLPVPLGATAFLFVMGTFALMQWLGGAEPRIGLLAGYFAGGCCWWLSSYLRMPVLVTERGIVPDLNRPQLAIAWNQVVDYFEQRQADRHRYVFLYVDTEDRRRRFELDVPSEAAPSVRRLVSEMLDRRFDRRVQRVYGNEPLER